MQQQTLNSLHEITSGTIFLMGGSFILGSLFTLLLLVLLDLLPQRVGELRAAAGKVAFSGEYRYEPGLARPHRLRLRIEELDAADLEAELMPTLRRNPGLLARALGRQSLPGWLDPDRGPVVVDDRR